MIRIAILGDIGAGKSFVSKQFNCPLFNADKEVAEIYKNDRSCYQKIKKALPKYIISDHLDKKFLLKGIINIKYQRNLEVYGDGKDIKSISVAPLILRAFFTEI